MNHDAVVTVVWVVVGLVLLAAVAELGRQVRSHRRRRALNGFADGMRDGMEAGAAQAADDPLGLYGEATERQTALVLVSDLVTDEEIARRRAAGEVVARHSEFMAGLPPVL